MSDAAGGDHKFDRRKSDVNLASLITRVRALEEWREAFMNDFRRHTAELQANTRLTEDIHGDTRGIVEFIAAVEYHLDCIVRRARAFKHFSKETGKWLAAVCGGAYSAYLLGKAFGWWV